MHRRALPLLLLVACTRTQDAGEHLGVATQPFASAQAVPLDFELDGRLVADTTDPATLRTLIDAQLLFTVGQLNGDSSVGRLGLLDVSEIHATEIVVPPPIAPAAPAAPDDAGVPDDASAPPPPPPPPPPPAPPRYDVSYHAKLPVAWGAATRPTSYTFTLPARLSEADQTAFAAKYGRTCVDPTEGVADAGHMFAMYRPRQPGCAPAADDVVTLTADVTPSAESTQGKYPEYHRVWQDGALDVVAVFTHEYATPTAGDEGALAYDSFVWRMHEYMRVMQPDDSKRSASAGVSPSSSAAGVSTARLRTMLPDGRSMTLDVRLVGTALSAEGPAFDEWYDGVTPSADLIISNGHAGLGANVRSLMRRGSFRSNQYVIWFANGCDTLAYVDRTLADRRAPLNPDDPTGTKYMDTVTNIMAGYFSELEETSVTFVRALVDVREVEPKTYEQIFRGIDPAQVAVVTGEEDNELQPLPPSPRPPGARLEPQTETTAPGGDPSANANGLPPDAAPPAAARDDGGCGIRASRDAGSGPRTWGALLLALFVALVARHRRSEKRSDRVSSSHRVVLGRFVKADQELEHRRELLRLRRAKLPAPHCLVQALELAELVATRSAERRALDLLTHSPKERDDGAAPVDAQGLTPLGQRVIESKRAHLRVHACVLRGPPVPRRKCAAPSSGGGRARRDAFTQDA